MPAVTAYLCAQPLAVVPTDNGHLTGMLDALVCGSQDFRASTSCTTCGSEVFNLMLANVEKTVASALHIRVECARMQTSLFRVSTYDSPSPSA